MGKVSKWFRGVLSLKKPDSSSSMPSTTSVPKPPKEKRRWSFVKSHRENDNLPTITTATAKTVIRNNDNHTIAPVAAPSALRLHGGGVYVRDTAEGTANREERAAVKIQAAFRGCLARRALRALKGLVKLQALVRGQVERTRTAERLQKMQLLLRAQAQVRAGRLRSSLIAKSSNFHLHGPATPDKVENPIRSKTMKYDQSSMLKRDHFKSYAQISGNKEKCWKTTDSWVDEKSWNRQRSFIGTCADNDERKIKILEMDSEKGIFAPKRRARNLFHSTNLALISDPYSQTLTPTKKSTIHHSGPIHREVHQSYSPPEGLEVEETPFCTANNSPQLFSGSSKDGSSKRSPFTPTMSDGQRSYASAYSDRPNYMAYTESSKAKVRSLSAPKQRTTRYERSGSSNRHSMNGFSGSRLAAQWTSALHASLTSKAYPDSGRLDKFGLPMSYRN